MPALLTGVSPKPLVKDGICEGVQEDEDGVVGWQVSLPPSAVQEEVGQVVQAPHNGVVVTLWVAVAYQRWKQNTFTVSHSLGWT